MGGRGVAVGGTAVAVGGSGVAVGGTEVDVGGIGVAVGGGDEQPIATKVANAAIKSALITRVERVLVRLIKVNSCSNVWSSTVR